mgnify:CR=1 FL=1
MSDDGTSTHLNDALCVIRQDVFVSQRIIGDLLELLGTHYTAHDGIDYTAHAGAVEALEKSKQLLLDNLNDEQTAHFTADKSFIVVAPDNQRYRIQKKMSYNVSLLDKDNCSKQFYCTVFEDKTIPVYDLMLSQKIMIESGDNNFFRLANKSGTSGNMALSDYVSTHHEYLMRRMLSM